MAHTFAITDEVRDILQRSRFADGILFLPAEQLERPLYERVNKVLVGAGGTWNRTARGHVFPDAIDPRPLLLHAIATGVATNRQQSLQAFYTPAALATQLVRNHLALQPGHRVLEPSAGHGALALAAAQYTSRADILCIEIDLSAVERLKGYGFPVLCQDFLTLPGRPVDCVVMNPPFTRGQDMAHVLHALQFLPPGGRLVALTSPTAGLGTTRTHQQFRTTMQAVGAVRSQCPADAFAASGTRVRPALWVLTMPRQHHEEKTRVPSL